VSPVQFRLLPPLLISEIKPFVSLLKNTAKGLFVFGLLLAYLVGFAIAVPAGKPISCVACALAIVLGQRGSGALAGTVVRPARRQWFAGVASLQKGVDWRESAASRSGAQI
jgi:hypothetical protein